MVHARPNDGQAHGHVDSVKEPGHLHGHVPLVVIHRHHPVERSVTRPVEHRVARLGPRGVDPVVARIFDGRPDEGIVLVSKQATFARVGIEPANGDPRLRDGHHPQRLVQQADHVAHVFPRHPLNSLPQRDVRAVVNHP